MHLIWVDAVAVWQCSAHFQIDRSTYKWFGSDFSWPQTDAAAAAAAHLVASRGS